MKYYNYDIVFQEVPDEVTLAINLTNCPNHCADCHSPHLWQDIGTPLDADEIDRLVSLYARSITCVCLMGGDGDKQAVENLARHLRAHTTLKIAWYSGRDEMPSTPSDFDYVKLGPYLPSRGGLNSPTTNQRMLKRTGPHWTDITPRFQK